MLCATERLAEMESDIIFNEEENKIPEELLCNLKATLPNGYKSKVMRYKEFSSSSYEWIIRLDIRNEDDALNWLRRYEENSSTSWRTLCTYPSRTQLIFKKTFRCHHNTMPKPNAVPSEKHTKCPAKVTITVKPPCKKSKDMELRDRPCEISLFLPHNHSLTSAAALKYRKPTEEVVAEFKDLLSKGHSPSSAWQSYKFDLQVKHGDEYYKAAGDGSICPSRKWVFDLYYSMFAKEFGESSGDAMVESLREYIKNYNEKCESVCATLTFHGQNLIICICDPLMKRVHTFLPGCNEIVFVDSSGNMDRHNSKVCFFLCPSIAGALPLGIVITFTETEDVLTAAFEELKRLFPETSPAQEMKLIITDDSASERNALRRCFPSSTLLLCKFHVLQAAMRYFWDSKHEVASADRQEVFTIFQQLVKVKDEEAFESAYVEALQNPVIRKYNFAVKYFERMRQRAPEWALCYRKAFLTRGNDTNNYCEANFRVLKDIVLRRTKAFSVVHLLNFLTGQLIDYYRSRGTDVINDRFEGYRRTKYFIRDSKLVDLKHHKVDDDTYIVTNAKTKQEYFVQIDNGVCSCLVGLQGAPCKHQYLVAKEECLSSPYIIRQQDKKVKLLFHKILTGKTEDSGWYESLQQSGETEQCLHSLSDAPSTSRAAQLGNINKNPAAISALEEEENLEFEKRKKEALKEYKINYFRILQRVNSDSKEFVPALEKYNKKANQCKSKSSLLSFIHDAGSMRGVPAIKKRKNLQGGKTIPVQPTAVARRKANLGGRRLQQTGRPPKRVLPSEHDYALPAGTKKKKKKKAPHSISTCLENNTSLGQ